ncbi:MAG: GNAT family N-acetyltransferase [Methyloprofundus sp.]|nr:GNAT family N-acetyltransferase [Methyloprofundus sp.]
MLNEFKKLAKDFRVYLRAFTLTDANTSHDWRVDDEMIEGSVGRKYFVSPDYEKKWVNDVIFSPGNSLKLAVCLKENHQHIGNAYLDNVDCFNQNALFGLMIGEKSQWGKGIGTEITLLMLYHAFYEMNLKRVYSYQLEDNIGSIKVHQKCGFQQEGVLRKAVFKHGELVNLNVMGILKEEFDQKVCEMLKGQSNNRANNRGRE